MPKRPQPAPNLVDDTISAALAAAETDRELARRVLRELISSSSVPETAKVRACEAMDRITRADEADHRRQAEAQQSLEITPENVKRGVHEFLLLALSLGLDVTDLTTRAVEAHQLQTQRPTDLAQH